MWNNISNVAAIIKNKMVRSTFSPLDLIPFAAKDEKFDGEYRDAAILPVDFVNAVNAANTGYYSVNLNNTSVVNVTTPRGVIEIVMDSDQDDPRPAFATAVSLTIANAAMDFSNPDNVYMQTSLYYRPAIGDSFIPYVISTGFAPTGSTYAIFNASPAVAGAVVTFAPTGGTTILAQAGITYTAVASTPSATGSGATFTVVRDGAGAISTVTLISAGSGYEVGDTLTILGTAIGGATPADDLTITVSTTSLENQFEGIFYLYYELYNF